MSAEFNWWLLIVGVVAGGALTWLVLADSNRREREIGERELPAEAGWIARSLGRAALDADTAEQVLRAHRRYLGFPPPDVLVTPEELDALAAGRGPRAVTRTTGEDPAAAGPRPTRGDRPRLEGSRSGPVRRRRRRSGPATRRTRRPGAGPRARRPARPRPTCRPPSTSGRGAGARPSTSTQQPYSSFAALGLEVRWPTATSSPVEGENASEPEASPPAGVGVERDRSARRAGPGCGAPSSWRPRGPRSPSARPSMSWRCEALPAANPTPTAITTAAATARSASPRRDGRRRAPARRRPAPAVGSADAAAR